MPLLANDYGNMTIQEFESIPELNEVIDLEKINFTLIEAGVFQYSNLYRIRKRSSSTNYHEELHASSNIHAHQMVEHDFFDHVNNRNKQFKTLENRVAATNYGEYRTLGENLYYGHFDLQKETTYRQLIEEITQAFIDSKSHEENLKDKDHNEMGNSFILIPGIEQGVFQYFYFVQNLGSRM